LIAKVAKTEVIFVSFETLKKPKDVGIFVKAWETGVQQAQKEVGALIAKATQTQQRDSFDHQIESEQGLTRI
jgi:elongator complex protein 5